MMVAKYRAGLGPATKAGMDRERLRKTPRLGLE